MCARVRVRARWPHLDVRYRSCSLSAVTIYDEWHPEEVDQEVHCLELRGESGAFRGRRRCWDCPAHAVFRCLTSDRLHVRVTEATQAPVLLLLTVSSIDFGRKVLLVFPHAGVQVVYYKAISHEQPITHKLSELDFTPGCCCHSCRIPHFVHMLHTPGAAR